VAVVVIPVVIVAIVSAPVMGTVPGRAWSLPEASVQPSHDVDPSRAIRAALGAQA
jgi:hypothetical protein